MDLLTPMETAAVMSCGAGYTMFLIAGLLGWRLLRRKV